MDPEELSAKRIILFRTDRLGDLVLSFPVVEALKASFTEARIDLLVAPPMVSLAKLQEHVSLVTPHIFRGPRGLIRLVRFLKTQHYDMAIHLYPRPFLALATFLARIPVRAGSAYRYYSFLFNRRIKFHRKTMDRHERDLNLKLLEGLKVPIRGGASTGLKVPQRARSGLCDLLLSMGINPSRDPFVVLHPGSGDSSLNWPASHYGILGRKLGALGFPVVLTGTKADLSAVAETRSCLGEKAIDLSGRLDLEQLAALISMAALVVSNSTGPLHLADALGIKLIGLYSPFFYSSPRRWGPYEQSENVFLPPGKACLKCAREECEDFNCMSLISPETVLRRARELLAPHIPNPSSNPHTD